LSAQAKERPREAELPEPGSEDVRLESVRTSFGEVLAVDGVNLTIPMGEFFTLLGPR
jgi:ABC-type sugar transport system ATPase subunit